MHRQSIWRATWYSPVSPTAIYIWKARVVHQDPEPIRYSGLQETVTYSSEVGKLADFTVFNRDLTAIVDGRITYQPD